MNPINLGMTETLIGQGKVRALMNCDIERIESDGALPKVVFKSAQFSEETFDAVIFALGGMSPIDFLKTARVDLDTHGEPRVNEKNESSVSGLYVIGDLIGKKRGGGSIIAGFNTAAIAVSELVKTHFERDFPPAFVSLDHLKF